MKKTLMLIGLGAAFMAVSLWVVLSGNRSAKAVRAKFRLGGAILTLLSATSCVPGIISCYDAPAPESGEVKTPTNHINIPSHMQYQEYRNGFTLVLNAQCGFNDTVEATVVNSNGDVLQSGEVVFKRGMNTVDFTLDVGDFIGAATLSIHYRITEAEDANIETASLAMIIIE